MKRQNRTALLNILSVVLLRGISIVTAPLFSRLLGTSGYGVVNIYNVWVCAIACVFPLQTMGTLVNAQVEYEGEERKRYQSSAMFLSVLSYGLCTLATVLFLQPVAELLKLSEKLVLMMLLQAFGTYCVNFLTTKYVYEFKAGRNLAISVGTTLLNVGLSVALILGVPGEEPYINRIWGTALTNALFGIPACILILKEGRTFFHKKYWKFCIPLAIPFIFYNLSDLALGQIDRIMLQRMMNESVVGQYSMALNLAGIMFAIFGALNNTWVPAFFEDKKNGEEDLVRQRAVNFLEVFTVLSLGFILLAPEVYHIFASRDYWPSTNTIPIVVTSHFLNFLCTFPINFEYYRKKTKMVAIVTVTAAIFNAGLNYLLIRPLGMEGAAIATAVSHLLQLSLHYIYARYRLGKEDYPFPLAMWGKYALCFIPAAVLMYLVDTPWLPRWGLGALIGLWELLRLKKRKVLI